MKILEKVKIEIQQTLGRAIPEPDEASFPGFYSQLELEHPELCSKLRAAFYEDAPEEPLFPEAVAQASTRGQAKDVIRRLFFKQDSYTGEWMLGKTKMGMVGLGTVVALFFAMSLVQPPTKKVVEPVAVVKPEEVPAPPVIPEALDAPAIAVEEVVTPTSVPEVPSVQPTYDPQPTYVQQPSYTPTYNPPVAVGPVEPQLPPGKMFNRIKRQDNSVLYRRVDKTADQVVVQEQQASAVSAGMNNAEAANAAMLASASTSSASQEQFAPTELSSSGTSSAGGSAGSVRSSRNTQSTAGGNSSLMLFRRTAAPVAPVSQGAGGGVDVQSVNTDRLSAGMIIPASLATGVLLPVSGDSVPVVVRTETDMTFIGTANLNAARRMEIMFKEVVVNGQSAVIRAQAYSPDGLPGLSVATVDMAPNLFNDLVRASATGVTSYVKALNEQATLIRDKDGTTTVIKSAPDLGWSVAGAVTNILGVPPTQNAFVRVAQIDRGMQILVTVLSGAELPRR